MCDALFTLADFVSHKIGPSILPTKIICPTASSGGSDSIRLAPIGSDGNGIQLGIYSHTEKKQHKNVINYYAEVSSIIIKLLFQILVRSVLSSYAASQLNIDVTQVTRLFNISSGIKTTPLQFHICMI